jgi:uncharacterized protein
MTWPRLARRVLIAVMALLTVAVTYETQAPSVAAGALLHPMRHAVTRTPSRRHERVEYEGDGVVLRGWRFPAKGPRRGTVIFLHGVADNRQGVIGIADRFTPLGFDVVGYDSRAHGESDGDVCTYGYFERRDLARVLDRVASPVALIGHSLGAAVALQAAPNEPRVFAIVAAETFADLRSIVRDRARRLLLPHVMQRAFEVAEERGAFRIDHVSPLRAAAHVAQPVLVVHGAADVETRPDHSRRVYAVLPGPKRLLIVPNEGHSRSLTGEVWGEAERWILDHLSH